jgi:phosphatidylserine decarboxylase
MVETAGFSGSIMRIAREGWIFIIPVAVLAAAALLIQWYPAALLFGLATAALTHFFRDPERRAVARPQEILSPADGTVTYVGPATDNLVDGLSTQISIMLSIFDVHVQRSPINGRVTRVDYKPGRSFVVAEKGSPLNEQSLIVIEGSGTIAAVRQIAGLLARRIVVDHREGAVVALGERIGMIKFGSRVDLFLPAEATVRVKLNEKVRVGLTVVAEMEKNP